MPQYSIFSLAGYAGGDAEVRQAGDKNVCNVNVCFTEKGKDGAEDRPNWFRVEAWGNWADAAQHIKKGDNVVVQGRLVVKKWQAEDGTERITPTVVVQNDIHVARREEGSPAQAKPRPSFGQTKQAPKTAPSPDEYPF